MIICWDWAGSGLEPAKYCDTTVEENGSPHTTLSRLSRAKILKMTEKLFSNNFWVLYATQGASRQND